MTEQQNTSPSASREIAVKKLVWEWPNEYGLVCRAVTPIGTYSVSDDEDRPSAMFCYLHLTDDGDCTRYAVKVVDDYLEPEEAQAAAQADYERRILSALDTTPGNTDPIAKDDDERVRGGWRDFWDWWSEDGCAIDTDPDVGWYDKRRDFAEIAFEAGRVSAPTEHPTEQPGVRDVLSKAANDAIHGYAERTDRYATGFRNGVFTMRKAILRSLAQEDGS